MFQIFFLPLTQSSSSLMGNTINLNFSGYDIIGLFCVNKFWVWSSKPFPVYQNKLPLKRFPR